ITAFAERLIADLDELQWPESIKQLQRNWIGRSDGALTTLPVAGGADPGAAGGAGRGAAGGAGLGAEVFTTRPDTLAGATYVVLAPEHPLVDRLLPESWPDRTPPAWTYPEGRGGAGDWTPRAAVAAYKAAT